jgi:hypothetical protein
LYGPDLASPPPPSPPTPGDTHESKPGPEPEQRPPEDAR